MLHDVVFDHLESVHNQPGFNFKAINWVHPWGCTLPSPNDCPDRLRQTGVMGYNWKIRGLRHWHSHGRFVFAGVGFGAFQSEKLLANVKDCQGIINGCQSAEILGYLCQWRQNVQSSGDGDLCPEWMTISGCGKCILMSLVATSICTFHSQTAKCAISRPKCSSTRDSGRPCILTAVKIHGGWQGAKEKCNPFRLRKNVPSDLKYCQWVTMEGHVDVASDGRSGESKNFIKCLMNFLTTSQFLHCHGNLMLERNLLVAFKEKCSINWLVWTIIIARTHAHKHTRRKNMSFKVA